MNGIVINPDINLDEIEEYDASQDRSDDHEVDEKEISKYDHEELIILKKNTLRAKLDSITMVGAQVDEDSGLSEDSSDGVINLKKNTLRTKMDSIGADYKQPIDDDMLESDPEEDDEPIILKKNTLRAKLDGIVMSPSPDRNLSNIDEDEVAECRLDTPSMQNEAPELINQTLGSDYVPLEEQSESELI